jgi:glycogen debranching enzyme
MIDTDEVLRISDRYYILATSARIDDRTRVLKHGDTFAIFDRFGDVEGSGAGVPGIYGIYHRDTRHLSRFRLRLADGRPLLLSSTIRDDNAALAVDLMNPDISLADGRLIHRGTIHVFRSMCLWDAACHERLVVHNYGPEPVAIALALDFGADFADIFEVRGLLRERRGRRLPAEVAPSEVAFGYEGLDRRLRRTRFAFDTPPSRLDENGARFELELGAHAETVIRFSIACESEMGPAVLAARSRGRRFWYEEAAKDAGAALSAARADEPQVTTSNEQFNDWLNRSLADLHMMRTSTPHGVYPYAGVPWFSTVFGRDGIVTAFECLWFDPVVARGVLQYLAATQADADSEEQDAQPGKVLHETRGGEMAGAGEIPFGRYYGSIDATPLFVALAGAYFDRTGDLATIRGIWPQLRRALEWIDRDGDSDGDGFVEYFRRSARGLVQQGWKDSQDSVFHADGELAEGPIALCEVQAGVYAARHAGARLARALGDDATAARLVEQAETLRRRFDEAFWCEDLGMYALALDGRKRPCRVRTSNAGQCLLSGIADPGRARRIAQALAGESFFTGWGIRTVASTERRFNPMSYHNGSVWPHDNALIATGAARYGHGDLARQVMTGLFDASIAVDLHRLPELFCGFPRRQGESPTLYPVSCSPQAWASGSVLLLLQACLGLTLRAAEKKIMFTRPKLPEYLEQVRIENLRLADARVDLTLSRHRGDVVVDVPRREGRVEVMTVE